jgi:hypothetical protein
MPDLETFFPAEIVARGSHEGNEWAWPLAIVPTVIASARAAGLATLGGQVQFRSPAGICELYWLNADSDTRRPGESWGQYVSRSAEEVLAGFQVLPQDITEFAGEIEQWSTLAALQQAGADLSLYLCFVLDFVTEPEHTNLENRRRGG